MKVAIVITQHQSSLEPFEEISLNQCYRILKNHDIFFALPTSLDDTVYANLAKKNNAKYNCVRFPDKDFSTYLRWNHLLVAKKFYAYFKEYDYMLHYHTDSFVFRDELTFWCNKGYDYIGAPFVKDFSNSTNESPFFGVGNGGFSLRKISSFLKVLNSFAYIRTPKELIAINSKKKGLEKLLAPFSLLKNLTFGNNTFHLLNDFYDHEDMFWGRFVNRKFDWYKVPSPEEAIPFSFDVQAQKLYNLNQQKLPFGCHAWWRFELDFWQPFIESYGYILNKEKISIS